MDLISSKIADQRREASDAKVYWSKPETQPLFYEQPAHYADAIAEQVRLTGVQSVLEFGCAAGRNLAVIRDHLSQTNSNEIQLTGIDINPVSIEAGQQEFELDLLLGDENFLVTLDDNSFDLVFTVSVLDHIPDPARALANLIRISKKYAIFVEPYAGSDQSKLGKIETISTGFGDKNAEVTPYTYMHDYRNLFSRCDADVLFELGLPTHLNKAGPLYRLFFLRKKSVAEETDLDQQNLISEAVKISTLRLLQTINYQKQKVKEAKQEFRLLDARSRKTATGLQTKLDKLTEQYHTKLDKLNEQHQTKLDKLTEQHQTQLDKLNEQYQTKLDKLTEQYQSAREANEQLQSDLKTVNRSVGELEKEVKNRKKQVSNFRRKLRHSETEIVKLHQATIKERKKGESSIRQALPHRVGSVVVAHVKKPLTWPAVPWRMFMAYRQFKEYERNRSRLGPTSAKPRGPVSKSGSASSQKAYKRVRGILSEFRSIDIAEVEQLVVERRSRAFEPNRDTICYVLHNSLPFASGGYATRGHGLATGLVGHGMKVIGVTRPGFPMDTGKKYQNIDLPKSDTIEGIEYTRNFDFMRSRKTARGYISGAADVYERRFNELKPEYVMAASFATWTGLPALIASRRLGIPFVYEVRGLAEVTTSSRDPDYKDSENYNIARDLEAITCRHADHVFTLTQAMKDELVSRGVDGTKITLLPNSCDIGRFEPQERDADLAHELNIPDDVAVIGYVGTFVDYEGLEDLAASCALLKQQGTKFRLLLVGSENVGDAGIGPISREVATIAEQGDFADWLIMPGRVPHDVVERYYSLIDIATFPRKPLPVTEMVSPMKPLEAMAMEKAIVVSSVRALSEMVVDGETGRVFEKGNLEDHARVLSELIKNPDQRQRLGKQARKWVGESRDWSNTAASAVSLFRQIGEQYLTERSNEVESATPESPQTTGAAQTTVERDTEKGSILTSILTTRHKPSEYVKSRSGRTAVKHAKSRLEEPFVERVKFVPLVDWELSDTACEVRDRYAETPGGAKIQANSWKRMDFSMGRIGGASKILDIGPGVGEFVNALAVSGDYESVNCIDVRNYGVYRDLTGRINRRMIDLFDLPDNETYEVVTCFEVLEHLPEAQVPKAVEKIRKISTRMFAVSMPLKEWPLSKYHFTSFDESLLESLFPDGEIFVLVKENAKSVPWVYIEVHKHPADRIGKSATDSDEALPNDTATTGASNEVSVVANSLMSRQGDQPVEPEEKNPRSVDATSHSGNPIDLAKDLDSGSRNISSPFVKSAEGEIAVKFAQSRLESWFVDKVKFLPLIDWELSDETREVRRAYRTEFGETVDTRIPIYNWKRMDFARQRLGKAESLLDIGPGLGEFVNGLAFAGQVESINCIDIRDYNLYKDFKGVINRRNMDLFDLPDDETYEIVTCFEVLEHLRPEDVGRALKKLYKHSTRMFAVSMPLKEIPLSRYHLTSFDEKTLCDFFPDGEIYVLSKDKYKNVRWVYVEVHKNQPKA